jgi:hypothetical protein
MYAGDWSPARTPCGAPQELDVDAEMARGLLPGALALSGKVRPAVSSVAGRTADALREFLHDPQVPGPPWARGARAAPSASCPLIAHVRPAPVFCMLRPASCDSVPWHRPQLALVPGLGAQCM